MASSSLTKSKSNSSNTNGARFMQPLLHSFLNNFSIPESFTKKLEEERDGCPVETVVLTTEDQPLRHWIVKVEGGRNFKDGWKEFCVENQLEVGDFLVFVHNSRLIFCVAVFDAITTCERRVCSSSDHHVNLKESKRDEFKFNIRSTACKRKQKEVVPEPEIEPTQVPNMESRPSSFCITLSPFNVNRGIIYIPKDFVVSTGLRFRTCDMKLVNEEERSWLVKLSCRKSNGQACITEGWTEFQAANNFNTEDVINFQILEAGEMPILKCYRKSKKDEMKIRSTTNKRKSEETEVEIATKQIPISESQSLSCHVTLTFSNVTSGIIYLPKDFMVSAGLHGRCCDMKLVNEEGKSWKVKLNRKKTGQACITEGFKDFQAANSFKPNNVIRFQVLESETGPALKCIKVDSSSI